jgi:hypothetical protein
LSPAPATLRPACYDGITALWAAAIRKLAAADGPLQLSLFDERDLAEIACPDYPGERLIACRKPALAGERARQRAVPCSAGARSASTARSPSPRTIGQVARDQQAIAAAAALDGFEPALGPALPGPGGAAHQPAGRGHGCR